MIFLFLKNKYEINVYNFKGLLELKLFQMNSMQEHVSSGEDICID